MMNVGSIPLSNGRQLPLLGLGTWLASDEAQLTTALRVAFDAGYRYIDTAEIYANEHVVGNVLKEYIDAGKLERENVFITTKLPLYGHKNPIYFIEQSLKKLQTDYIDLYLIHLPLPMRKLNEGEVVPEGVVPFVRKNPGTGEIITLVPDVYPFIDTWRVLEKYYNEGKLKAIGVSNFNEEQLQGLYDLATIKPHNIQVECHILFQQKSLFNLCKKLNVTLTAYGPLGSPGRGVSVKGVSFVNASPMEHPLVKQLAQKFNKTPAQILIRQLMQRGISTIPKSTNPDRILENFNVFDFELTPEQMAEFDAIDEKEKTRIFLMDFALSHPWHPWRAEAEKALEKQTH